MGSANGNGHARQEPDENFPLVLVVEDSARDLEFTVGMLRRNGFRVVAAESYEEAVTELGQREYRCAVVDYWLTDRMKETGEDVLRFARQEQPACERVMFSADNLAQGAAERVGAAFFSKDDTASGLVALVRVAVNRARLI